MGTVIGLGERGNVVVVLLLDSGLVILVELSTPPLEEMRDSMERMNLERKLKLRLRSRYLTELVVDVGGGGGGGGGEVGVDRKELKRRADVFRGRRAIRDGR